MVRYILDHFPLTEASLSNPHTNHSVMFAMNTHDVLLVFIVLVINTLCCKIKFSRPAQQFLTESSNQWIEVTQGWRDLPLATDKSLSHQ